VFTGARPGRFVSHADVRWLQEGGAKPKLGRPPRPHCGWPETWTAPVSQGRLSTELR
jgi:hypothetical protein